MEILLDHNSDPNKISSKSGGSAFDVAMTAKHYDVAAVLFGSSNTEAWTASKLKAEGHTAADAKKAGFILDDLLGDDNDRGSAFSLTELKEAFSLAELSECQAFSVSELGEGGEGGFAPSDFKEVGLLLESAIGDLIYALLLRRPYPLILSPGGLFRRRAW